jgi:pyruvate,water dikinase
MYIKFFEEIYLSDTNIAGGKGASLGEMTNAGIPVPNGFIVTTNAFIDFSDKEISKYFKEELLIAFNKLGAERVAVRSSAIAEDSSVASWAGQLESYLNVGRENLIDAVRKCWDSINSERVKNYSQQYNIPSSQLVVAVVIQKMVNSEVSGVMFTVNPITNNKNEIMIEAAHGLGELLVQGEITPDNYIISKKELTLTEGSLGSQRKMLVYENEQNKEISIPNNIKNEPILNARQLKEIADLGIKIEKHYGFPCDIEWAFEKGKFFIVQSRPITTLA